MDLCKGCGQPSRGLRCDTCRTPAHQPRAVRKRLAKRVRVPVLSEARWEGDTLVVVLPIPHRTLHPNGRLRDTHVKAKRIRQHRGAAQRIVEAQRKRPGWAVAYTRATLYAPDAQARDEDGFAASLKHYWDGIADAGIVGNDRDMRHGPARIDIDRARPRVELVLRPVDNDEPAREG